MRSMILGAVLGLLGLGLGAPQPLAAQAWVAQPLALPGGDIRVGWDRHGHHPPPHFYHAPPRPRHYAPPPPRVYYAPPPVFYHPPPRHWDRPHHWDRPRHWDRPHHWDRPRHWDGPRHRPW